MKRIILLIGLLLCLAATAHGQAEIPRYPSDPPTCNPARGLQYYNTTTQLMMYCSGLNVWSPIGTGVPATAAGSPAQTQVNDPGNPGHFGGSTCQTFPSLTLGPVNVDCDWHSKGPNPYVDVTRFGASGSLQNTTGSCTSGQTSVTLTSAIDFVNGQGIVLNKCGPTSTATVPASPSVTVVGTAGSTTYSYQVVAFDYNLGTPGPTSSFTTTTGNATLAYPNYNNLTWTCSTWTPPANTPGMIMYVIYKSGSYLGMTVLCSYRDIGQTAYATRPFWVPLSVPGALNDDLETTISSGAGTTSLTLAASASNTISGVYVQHDDTPAYKAAETAALGNGGGTVYFPLPGSFPTGNLNIGLPGSGGNGQCSVTHIGWLELRFGGSLAPFKPLVMNCTSTALQGGFLGSGFTGPSSSIVDNGLAPMILVTSNIANVYSGAVTNNVIDGFQLVRNAGDDIVDYCNGPSNMVLLHSQFQSGAGRAVNVGCATTAANNTGGFGFFARWDSFASFVTGGFGLNLSFGQTHVVDSNFNGCPVVSDYGMGTTDWSNLLSENNSCDAFVEFNTSVVASGGTTLNNTFTHIQLADPVGAGDKYLVKTIGTNANPLGDVTTWSTPGGTASLVGGSFNAASCSTHGILGGSPASFGNCNSAASYAGQMNLPLGSHTMGPSGAPFGNTTLSLSPPGNGGGPLGIFAVSGQQCCTAVGALTYWTNAAGSITSWIAGDTSLHTQVPMTLTQGSNGANIILGSRFTNTSPTGNYLDFKDSSGITDIFKVDVSGNITANSLTAATTYATPSASVTGSIGATTMATAGASGNKYTMVATATQTVVGVGCTGNTTIVLQIGYTDPVTNTSITASPSATSDLQANSVQTNPALAFGNNGAVGNKIFWLPMVVNAKASTTVTYTTIYSAGAGCTTNPAYYILPTLVEIQ